MTSRAASKLTVEKIGGTSMTRFSEVLSNIILKDPQRIYGRVYVVSAYAGVTNELLEHKQTRGEGIYHRFAKRQDYEDALASLAAKLCDINQRYVECGLDLDTANRFITDRVRGATEYLGSMASVLASGYLQQESLLLAARELLASLGEMHSAFNTANVLQQLGHRARFVDLSGWRDERELTIDERIASELSQVDPTKEVAVVTGYAKGTEGIMREFDRGYSEVTFSKAAVFLNASEAIIHKEFHLCSADPRIVGESKAKPVCNTNFDVADQLADVGMEAIHPKASKPLEMANIGIRVRNAFDPTHDGTLITQGYINPESKTEIVTGADRVSMLEVHDARMVAQVGFDLGIMQILARHGVSYISKATNANTIGMTLWDEDISDALLEELRAAYDLVSLEPAAIVCAIGSNIAKPGIMALAAGALAKDHINIISVSQTARQTNMQFVIARDDFVKAQQALHRDLCE